MAEDFVVRLRSIDPKKNKELLRIKKILANPEPIMKQIGIILLGEAQKAFREQRLGTLDWPPRYPGQQPPYVNVAGIVSDFIAGRASPPARRFQNRPAGIDTAQTLRSLTPDRAITTIPFTVQVKSNTEGAKLMTNGGTTTQLLTKTVKARLASWMKSERRRGKKESAKSQPKRSSGAAAERLGWLFSKKVLKTEVAKRPFLGITKDAEMKIIRITGGEFVRATKS